MNNMGKKNRNGTSMNMGKKNRRGTSKKRAAPVLWTDVDRDKLIGHTTKHATPENAAMAIALDLPTRPCTALSNQAYHLARKSKGMVRDRLNRVGAVFQRTSFQRSAQASRDKRPVRIKLPKHVVEANRAAKTGTSSAFIGLAEMQNKTISAVRYYVTGVAMSVLTAEQAIGLITDVLNAEFVTSRGPIHEET